MDKTELTELEREVRKILPVNDRRLPERTDAAIAAKIPDWIDLARITRSAVLVFDCLQDRFVYVSDNMLAPFGLRAGDLTGSGHRPVLERIHPGDIPGCLEVRAGIYKFMRALPPEEKKDYRMVHEMRVRTRKGDYLRIIEQEQVIELDDRGETWLLLSVVSPDAGRESEPGRSHLYNHFTGEQIFFEASGTRQTPLTPRELTTLRMMRQGLQSKEIAAKMGISINTVSTYRQHILRKLQVGNSIEAINLAKVLRLVE